MIPFDPKLAIACAKRIHGIYQGHIATNVLSPETDTQAQVVSIDGNFHYGVTFPGTASWRDCLTDAKIRKAKSGAGQLHRGFCAAAGSVYDGILAALPKSARVVVSGHSLGGAVATIIADWLLSGGYQVETVITFGSPRVGNRAWARTYNRLLAERTYRIVNAGDPVPHVPWVFGTYRHVETLIYLNNTGGVDTSPIVAAAKEAADRAMSARGGAATAGSAAFVRLSKHTLPSYITKLEHLDWTI